MLQLPDWKWKLVVHPLVIPSGIYVRDLLPLLFLEKTENVNMSSLGKVKQVDNV